MLKSIMRLVAAVVLITVVYTQAPVAAQAGACASPYWLCLNTGGAPQWTGTMCQADGYQYQGFECEYWWAPYFNWGEWCGPTHYCTPDCESTPEGCPA